ncbi:MAG: nodulation protein NfeD [Acidobacteriia bacterium]|nr:nodulation protein NfeD [Terriglobia bacterium]
MSTVLRFAIISAVLCLAAGPPARAEIARIDLNGTIDPITAEYIVKSIGRARVEHAQFILIQLRTPGGFGSSMEEIISAMLNSPIPVVVYVAPSGSSAASAGFFLLMAADVAAMAPGTNTGAAHPLLAIAGFPVEGGEAGKTLTDKITSNATAYLRSITGKRHRNIAEAEKGIVESKSFTETEALEKHLIDFVAKDEGELFRQLQGYKAQLFSGQEVILAPQGQAVVVYQMTAREKFLATISQPNLALILGVLGLILLYIEFTHPGMVAPGVIGGICLLLAILGFSFLPINYVGVLLILLAIGLFVAEVKVQGFGILGLGGVVSMVMGMLILVDSPDPAVRIGIATALSAALPFAVIFIILLFALIQSYRQKASTGSAGMIGLVGVADSEVFASGRVRVRGEYWQAQSSVPIAAGRPVRIVGIENLMLKVEEVQS